MVAHCTLRYGIPDTAVIAAVLDSAYGSGTQCGTGSGLAGDNPIVGSCY